MRKLAALLIVAAGCHVALGLEEATEVEGSSASVCRSDAQCDDDEPCTTDTCSDGECSNDPLPDGPAGQQVAGDCQRVVCSAGEQSVIEDTTDVMDDGLDCTEDVCNGTTPANNPIAGGTPCDDAGGQFCNAAGLCVECFTNDHCDGSDTCGGGGTEGVCGCDEIDCGVRTCGLVPDPVCGGATDCYNQMKDVNESDVDCGGLAMNADKCNILCVDGQNCFDNVDCVSGNCAMGTCAP